MEVNMGGYRSVSYSGKGSSSSRSSYSTSKTTLEKMIDALQKLNNAEKEMKQKKSEYLQSKEKYEKEKESFVKEFKESTDPEVVATFKSIFVNGRFDKFNDASETKPFEDIDDELE